MIYLYRIREELSRIELHAMEKRCGWAILRRALGQFSSSKIFLPFDEILEVYPHGKPHVKGNPFYFNLSHSGGIVACGVADCEIGVDLEKKRCFSDRLAERVSTEAERSLIKAFDDKDDALTHLWTLKESYMKYTGLGFAQGILSTEFSTVGQRPELLSGDGNFFSLDLGDAWLTVCTEYPISQEISWLEQKELQDYFL